MNLKKTATILNGFIHDFAAGYWLAAVMAIALIHHHHLLHPEVLAVLNGIERIFFWNSVGAMIVIFATGAGRTFTYVENYYGPDAEKLRRRMLIIKHIVLFAAFGAGYFWVFGKVFH